MNIFRETLEAIIAKVDGMSSVLIVGIDGIIIDRAYRDGVPDPVLNYDLVAAEYTSLLKTSLRTAEDVETGTLLEMTIITRNYVSVIRMLTDEYYVMAFLATEGNFGRARYELRRAQLLLEKEFQI